VTGGGDKKVKVWEIVNGELYRITTTKGWSPKVSIPGPDPKRI